MEPHFDFILEARRKRQSWQGIADALIEKGVKTTKQAVHIFMKRRLKWRYPLGMAPAEGAQSPRNVHAEKTHTNLPALTKNAPAPDEFTPDSLTLRAKKKPQDIWAKL